MKAVSTIFLSVSLLLFQVNCFSVTRGIYERCGGLHEAPAGVVAADQQWADCPTGTYCKNYGGSFWQCVPDDSAPGLKNWANCNPFNNMCAVGLECRSQDGGNSFQCQFPSAGASSKPQPQTPPPQPAVATAPATAENSPPSPPPKVTIFLPSENSPPPPAPSVPTKLSQAAAEISTPPPPSSVPTVSPPPTDVTPATSLGPVMSGTTTRYWDCCKPSCAWPGKSPLVNSPVKTCRTDGSTASADEQSGCGGGTAFACENQTPWEINSELAYGFAAKGYDGDQAKENCCACFEFKFTSTAIKGKRMIVQVTNTGVELEPGHFDVALPGGGQGIFKGCSVQFSGKDLGAEYGGMSSADQCKAFPEGGKLRKGCEFRFRWYANADNPTMEYHKVACPAELTAITGCKQS